jgi:hypothetical protein
MFDPTVARDRLDRLWALEAHFGMERGSNTLFLDEIVSDRMQLLSGFQILRDELQFAMPPGKTDREASAADMRFPSVLTTLAHTNCGDRIHHGEVENYQRIVASRFATLSEMGTLKPEAFHPTGGGTEDGATLAHVTWAHALDEPLRARLYNGHAQSYVMCAFDLKTHVGREADNVWGRTRESRWREPRAACGAIVGMLASFDPHNDVHRRLRNDLGDGNFDLLSTRGAKTNGGVDVTAVVAAAIVAVQGMLETARALCTEMDERGLAHLTASITVNRPGLPDTMIYLARASVFHGELATQGFGLDANKFTAEIVPHHGEQRLLLAYDGHKKTGFPIEREPYKIRDRALPSDIYA